MRRMTRGVGERDHAAERHTEHDRMSDPQNLAERPHIVTPLRQCPGFLWTGFAPAVAAMVQIDDLRDIRQRAIGGLVERVVEAWPAMEQKQCRLLPHGRTV